MLQKIEPVYDSTAIGEQGSDYMASWLVMFSLRLAVLFGNIPTDITVGKLFLC